MQESYLKSFIAYMNIRKTNVKKKNGYRLITVFLIIMAGATGFEPVPKVLETRVLPLTPCP